MITHSLYPHKLLFALTLLVSFSFHAAMLYVLQDLPIQYSFGSNGHHVQHLFSQEQENKLKKQRRQTELNTLINQVLHTNTETKTINISKNPSVIPTLQLSTLNQSTTPQLFALQKEQITITAPILPPTDIHSKLSELSHFSLDELAPALFDSIQDPARTLLELSNNALAQAPAYNAKHIDVVQKFEHLPCINWDSHSDISSFLPEAECYPITYSLGILSQVFNANPSAMQGNAIGALYGQAQGGNELANILPQVLSPGEQQKIEDSLLEHEQVKPQTLQELTQNDPTLLEKIAASSDFTAHITYSPKTQGQGYIFRLQLAPKATSSFKKIRQNYFFLLDRSHSIDKQRYEISKQALAQSISKLSNEDCFNILVFDERVVSFAEIPLHATGENIEQAKRFLSQQQHGGLLASTELYASLDRIVPKNVADDEMNTAILLSDGDTYLNREARRLTIKNWTDKNQGKIALFSLACGKGNNLPLLSLLSNLNKGALHYAPTNQELAVELQRLMYSLQSPIAKDIQLSVVPAQDSIRMSIYPPNHCMPQMYVDRPLTIYGSINQLSDFYLFFQGKYYDRWIDIKQHVTFQPQDLCDDELERQWTLQRAYHYYEEFLHSGQSAYLQAVRYLLQPLHVPLAFE